LGREASWQRSQRTGGGNRVEMIEEFFEANQHTVAALAAAGTFAAVITSLALAYIARRADRTRLRVRANLVTIFHASIDPKSAPEFLQVNITNHGRWAVRIPAMFFYWKAPLKREFMGGQALGSHRLSLDRQEGLSDRCWPEDVGDSRECSRRPLGVKPVVL
jgi:hypothetical protein